jgi:hypothetical protein
MSNFWAALKGAKKMEWIIFLAAAAILILLVLNQNTQDAEKTHLESRMEAVLCTVRGAGRVRVLISQGGDAAAFSSLNATGDVRGVVIVADGADDVRVALELASAAQALLGIDLEKIQVLKMGDGR